MIQTTRAFCLFFLALIACCFTYPSSSHAQPIAHVPEILCPATVYDQMVDVSQQMAEFQKFAAERALDEQNDPKLKDLACWEFDISRHKETVDRIIAASSGGWGGVFQQINREIDWDDVKQWACETATEWIQYQIDQCFNITFIERSAIANLLQPQCLIEVDASLALNSGFFGYQGFELSGSVRGPGGFEFSGAVGADAEQVLSNLFTNWEDRDTSYTRQTRSRCGRLDPNITNTYDQDYYDNLAPGEIPAGTSAGDEIVYNNVGSYTVVVDGTPQQRQYENRAECYGFKETIPFVPCGYEADGVTPAACGCCYDNPETLDNECAGDSRPLCAEQPERCCNIEYEDCSRSGLTEICPCNQGGLESFVNGVCEVGVPACCNGDLNECEFYTDVNGNQAYDYCEGTEPEELDCEQAEDDLFDQLQLSDEQLIERCDPQFVADTRVYTETTCAAIFLDQNACNREIFCQFVEPELRFLNLDLYGCTIDEDGVTSFIVQECRRVVDNQGVIDQNADIINECGIDVGALGPYTTPNDPQDNVSTGGGGGIPNPTPVGGTCEQRRTDCIARGEAINICNYEFDVCEGTANPLEDPTLDQFSIQRSPSTPSPAPAPTAPTPSFATPSNTPSAGSGGTSGSGGSQNNGGGNILQNLF